jgi:hypothetical protein
MSGRYESERSVMPVLITALAASMFTNIIGAILRPNPDERVRHAQEYNAEIGVQLVDEGHRDSQHLLVDDRGRTFTYDSPNDGHCTGRFEVQNSIATVVGPIACTQTLPNPAHS